MKTSVGRTVDHLHNRAEPRFPLSHGGRSGSFSRSESPPSDHVCSGAEEAIPQSHSGKTATSTGSWRTLTWGTRRGCLQTLMVIYHLSFGALVRNRDAALRHEQPSTGLSAILTCATGARLDSRRVDACGSGRQLT